MPNLRKRQMSNEQVAIFDTTLRDGEQSPGCSMNLEEKLRMARQLDALGVDVVEAGFPMASEDDFRAVHAVAREVRRPVRSEEHTSELQSPDHLVCRLLLEKKKN